MRPTRTLLAAAGVVAAVVAATPAAAAPLSPGPLVQTSGASPFAGCTADAVAAQSGTAYLHSEVEPWIDVNPTDGDGDGILRDNIVGIYQQDRWSNGGARGLVASVSFDGGTSWAQSVVPDISLCSGGAYDRSTDPWVSFAPDGTLHQLALSFNDVAPPFEPRDFDHALLASTSSDGGLTWSTPRVVIRDTDANVFNDKQTITADPHDADFVYAVWDRLVFPHERASVVSSFRALGYRGPTWFARSTDGGETWEPARMIYDPGQVNQTLGNQIVVLPNGDLVNVFDLIFNFKNARGVRGLNVALIRSTDRGATWSKSPIIVDKLGTIGNFDPETGDPVRTGDIIPEVAVDARTGALYVVWQDARPSGGQYDSILFSQSLDGGFTWSRPVQVNQTPTNVAPGNRQAFTPSVHVDSDGVVSVTYYDFRANDAAPPLWTDYFAVHCHSACTSAASWTGSETRLTDVSFDMRQAPNAGGFFTGDYEGLASDGRDFLAYFSQPHEADPSSAFFRRYGPEE